MGWNTRVSAASCHVHARRPSVLQIHVPHRIAERQHAIVVPQVVRRHAAGIRYGAMVRVVEEQPVAAVRRAVFSDPVHQVVVVPLVHEHYIGIGQGRVEVQRIERVARASQVGERLHEAEDGAVPAVGDEVLHAPCGPRFIDAHGEPAIHQLGGDASQEMRITVVPVGDQRVIEHDNVHDGCPSWGKEKGKRKKEKLRPARLFLFSFFVLPFAFRSHPPAARCRCPTRPAYASIYCCAIRSGVNSSARPRAAMARAARAEGSPISERMAASRAARSSGGT